MAAYDFSTLSSADFEELVCDLLNAMESQKTTNVFFKTFKDGKDKGIDFRFSIPQKNYYIIGQAKHLYRSSYSNLRTILKNQELAKVTLLNPHRYILATSLDLTVHQTEDILFIMSPYIIDLSDIYALKDLNRLLELFPDVVKKHFKLWFNSTEVLQSIIHYAIEGRSNEFIEKELKKKIRLYVPTIALKQARNILDAYNFVIITGGPGVGKTTTAELLLYEKISNKYELVYLYDDIRDIEEKISKDNKPQIFYYDDFLGHNAMEMVKARGSETALLKVLRRISLSDNKKFIMTTRTFILNAATNSSEKLRHFNIQTKTSTVELTNYDQDTRLKLFQNHIDESPLNPSLLMVLNEQEVQRFVTEHINFNPRSIEFITLNETLTAMTVDEYRDFIYSNFNTPTEIWRHAYEQQIDDSQRILLNTMVSFGDEMDVKDLEIAFMARLDYEAKYNNHPKPLNAFKNAFRVIEGGFISTSPKYLGELQFINHSLVDFLVDHLHNNRDEVIRITEAASFLTQLTARAFALGEEIDTSTKKNMSSLLRHRLLSEYNTFIYEDTKDKDILTLLVIWHSYFSLIEVEQLLIKFITQVKNWDIVGENQLISFWFEYFLHTINSTQVITILSEINQVFIIPLLFNKHDLEEILYWMNLFVTKYNADYSMIFKGNIGHSFNEKISLLLERKIEDDIDTLLTYSHAQDFVNGLEQESISIKESFAKFGISANADFGAFSEHDWQA